MDTLSKFTFPGILLLLTLVFGFWLSHAGKPYNGILFNIHKLIALGGVGYTGWQFFHILQAADPPALLPILLTVATLCVIAIFASGGLMSAGQLNYVQMLLIHRVGLAALLLTLGTVMYLLRKTI